MAGIPLTRTAHLRELLLDALPAHDWSIAKAGVAVGYSPRYAESRLPAVIRHDARFCAKINERRQAAVATQGDEIDKLTKSWAKIAHDERVTCRDRLKAGELLGKTFGIFSETRVIESASREQVLSQAELEEGQRLATLRLDTHQGYDITPGDIRKSLPGGDIRSDTDILDVQPAANSSTTAGKAAPNAEASGPADDLSVADEDGAPAAGARGLPPILNRTHCSPVPPGQIPPGPMATPQVDNGSAGAKGATDSRNRRTVGNGISLEGS